MIKFNLFFCDNELLIVFLREGVVMPEKLVSIIIPVYNARLYVKRCLDSIVNQTYKNLQILIIDDGSFDGSSDICELYMTDKRVQVFHQKNSGASAARNFGLDRAEGEYILFVDADDYIDTNLLDKAVHKMEQYGADILLFDVNEITEKGVFRFINDFEKQHIKLNELDIGEIVHLILIDSISNMACNKLYRSRLWDHFRFPIGYCYEDLFIQPSIFQSARKFIYLADTLYYNNRINPNSTTSELNDFNSFNRYSKFRAYKEHERMARYLQDKEAEKWAIEHAVREAIKTIYINFYSNRKIHKEEVAELKAYLENHWNRSIKKRINLKLQFLRWSVFHCLFLCQIYGCIRHKIVYYKNKKR